MILFSLLSDFILNNLPILPIAIGLLTAPLMLFLRQHPKGQKSAAVLVSLLLLAVAVIMIREVYTNGILVYDIGEFGKYGIVLVADMLSSLMVLLTSFIGFAVIIYSFDYIEAKSLNISYYPLFYLMLAGIFGIFLTGDLFNLFVFFEIMFLSSTGLIMANEALSVTETSHKAGSHIQIHGLGNARLIYDVGRHCFYLRIRRLAEYGRPFGQNSNHCGNRTNPVGHHRLGSSFHCRFRQQSRAFPASFLVAGCTPDSTDTDQRDAQRYFD